MCDACGSASFGIYGVIFHTIQQCEAFALDICMGRLRRGGMRNTLRIRNKKCKKEKGERKTNGPNRMDWPLNATINSEVESQTSPLECPKFN